MDQHRIARGVRKMDRFRKGARHHEEMGSLTMYVSNIGWPVPIP